MNEILYGRKTAGRRAVRRLPKLAFTIWSIALSYGSGLPS